MASIRYIIFFYLFRMVSLTISDTVKSEEPLELSEEFSEELLLKPLPDRKILAHFDFASKVPATSIYGRHHRLFPKAVYQLAHKYRIREMEVSFTQGRWKYEQWGGFDPISVYNAKPPGVELWATFDVPLYQMDAAWRNLTHALSGLFCASINFLESSAMYSAPRWGFRNHSDHLRYGVLPREAVCTENLTPWLKLLPCRDKAGLASVMYRPSIYRTFYHSQRLRLISSEFESSVSPETGILLEQTLTIVLQPAQKIVSTYYNGTGPLQPNWSISSLFGRKIAGKCVLAKSSSVFLEFDRDLLYEMERQQIQSTVFEVSPRPDSIIREMNDMQSQNSLNSSVIYHYFVDKYGDLEPFDLTLAWRYPLKWSCHHAPFSVSRFLLGSGNERGSIAISLRSIEVQERLSVLERRCARLPQSLDACNVRVAVFQMVPWYVKVYYHTLKILLDGQPRALSDVVEKIHVLPSEDKSSPGMMELLLKLPLNIQSTALVLQFDKGFLHIDEYPPDANQGFDIPSALVSFLDFESHVHYSRDDFRCSSQLLSRFQEKKTVQIYTEILLVPLPTPDFSMPYNVITFTCTVLALYFGSLHNVLRRRIGEEQILLKKAMTANGLISQLVFKLASKVTWKKNKGVSDSPSASIFRFKVLLKVVLVAVIAMIWHHLSE